MRLQKHKCAKSSKTHWRYASIFSADQTANRGKEEEGTEKVIWVEKKEDSAKEWQCWELEESKERANPWALPNLIRFCPKPHPATPDLALLPPYRHPWSSSVMKLIPATVVLKPSREWRILFSCDKCGKLFSRHYEMMDHMEKVHLKRAIARCFVPVIGHSINVLPRNEKWKWVQEMRDPLVHTMHYGLSS